MIIDVLARVHLERLEGMKEQLYTEGHVEDSTQKGVQSCPTDQAMAPRHVLLPAMKSDPCKCIVQRSNAECPQIPVYVFLA